jgi:hypothetical protein
MRSIYFTLASLLLIRCTKADIAPTSPKSNISTIQNVNTFKTDTLKSVSYNADTDTSNPNYWYNGTTGTALIQVTCKDCTAIATIGTTAIPFMFNANGVGVLKYTPAPGLPIQIDVCPNGNKTIKTEIFNNTNTALYSYSGAITGNWSGTYINK